MSILDRIRQQAAPAVLSQAAASQSYWRGEWDPDPVFYTLYQPRNGEVQSLPDSLLGIPIPREKGDYTFIGSNLPWRGLEVVIDIPNTTPSSLIAEYPSGSSWKKNVFDKTHYNYCTLSRDGRIAITPSARVWKMTTINGIPAYWVRLSVTANLSPELSGWSIVTHNAPILADFNWEMKKRKLSACENRPGLRNFYVMILGKDGKGVYEAEVGLDTVASHGRAYDHKNIYGLTDENGYLEWMHLGIPTVYNLFINGELVVENIRLDAGNEYCGTGRGSWRPVNKPGTYSFWFELQYIGN